jgi:tRNA(adenine34) deaminase
VDDTVAMRLALDEAACSGPDVPVGAVIVLDDRVLGRGHNEVEATGDPTAHAEIVAIRRATAELGRPRLEGATLYVTLEPCVMCAGAIVQARLARVVFGCDDPKAGAVRSLYTVLSDARLNHRCRVVPNVCGDSASAILSGFFEALRRVER